MKSDRKLLFVKISLLTAALTAAFIMTAIIRSTDKSSPYTLWMRKIVNTGFERDEYILIRHNNIKLIKQIKCLPGDELYTINDCFYCNAEMLGCAKLFDRKGNFTTPFYYNGTIPKFNYFVMGEHKDSYDSRYIGFINTGQVDGALWAIK